MSTALISGSLSAVSRAEGKPLAQTFIGADVVVLVDTSGSMGTRDTAQGLTRYDVACQELASLQASLPGKVAVLSFSGQNQVMFCPDGRPHNFGGGTDLAGALRFAKVADVPGIRFVVISDGEPDSEAAALSTARGYTNRIDVIYVGSELNPRGRDFLTKLAAQSGGTAVTVAAVGRQGQLSSEMRKLLGRAA
jgi:hypothetical protein